MEEEEDIIPSCSETVDDWRISCSNSESLRTIFEIAVKQVSDFAEKNFKEQNLEFVNQFSEVFKNALQENIKVNGLPWVVDKKQLSTPEKEDHNQMVDDAVLGQLCNLVQNVASKRKLYPQKCRQIASLKSRHSLLNLNKTRVKDVTPSTSSLLVHKNKDSSHLEEFSEFCKDVSSSQQALEKILKERENLIKKTNIASSIQLQHKNYLKSIASDETVAVSDC